MRTVLVTGGLGFIGSRFIKMLLEAEPNTRVINVDAGTYAAADSSRFGEKIPRVRQSFPDGGRHAVVYLDLASTDATESLRAIFCTYEIDAVVHFAAETHVDRSIDGSLVFTRTNVLGTHHLLEAAREKNCPVVYVSTDEVYGPFYPPPVSLRMEPSQATSYGYMENQSLGPRNPYSASKAAAEHLVTAYHHTYGLPVTITRGCNTYGPYQHPEKFLPLFVANAVEGKKLPLYGNGGQLREWLHVDDHCSAIIQLAGEQLSRETYNVGSGERHTNYQVAVAICELAGRDPREAIQLVADRPGHDRCYMINSEKLRCDEDWTTSRTFLPNGLKETFEWYLGDEGQKFIKAAGEDARRRRGVLEEKGD